MKQILLFLIIVLVSFLGHSQDTIITYEGDTIDCKITRVTTEFIHFTVYDQSGIVLMRSRLPLNTIQYYEQSDEEQVDGSNNPPKLDEQEKFILEDYKPPKFRLSFNTGYTYQLGGYDGLPESYKTQLQSLWNIGSDFHYFPSNKIGLGFKVNHIFTEANQDFEPPISTSFGFSSLRDEQVRFTYYAVSILYRNLIYGDQAIHYFLAGGLVNYRTDLLGDGVAFYQEGDTFGMTFGLLYDFMLLENLGLGVGVEALIANLSEFDNNGIIVPADFNISRIDLSIGIRLYK